VAKKLLLVTIFFFLGISLPQGTTRCSLLHLEEKTTHPHKGGAFFPLLIINPSKIICSQQSVREKRERREKNII